MVTHVFDILPQNICRNVNLFRSYIYPKINGAQVYIRTWVNLEHIRKKKDWIDQMGFLYCIAAEKINKRITKKHCISWWKWRFYFHFFSKVINILFLSKGPSFFVLKWIFCKCRPHVLFNYTMVVLCTVSCFNSIDFILNFDSGTWLRLICR